MLGMCLKILATALCILVDGKHEGPQLVESPRALVKRNQFSHEAAKNLHKLPKLLETHLAGRSFRLAKVPEVKHKKKPGEGYEKGSPLFDKQQKHKADEALPGPTDRHRPSLAVILAGVVLGVMVLTIAGCVNRDFLVPRYLEKGYPPVSAKTYSPDISSGFPQPTGVDATLPPSYQLQPQQQQPVPVSMMPGQMPQQLAPPPGPTATWNNPAVSMSLRNSAPGSGTLGPAIVAPPPNLGSPRTGSPNTSGYLTAPMPGPAPGVQSGAIYASMPPQLPPQGPGYLPPPRSSQYASMPPARIGSMM